MNDVVDMGFKSEFTVNEDTKATDTKKVRVSSLISSSSSERSK